MSEIIREKDVDSMDLKQQVSFYKNEFKYQHCELDGCGHEVGDDWVQYNGSIYCESCFDWLIQEEKETAKKEMEKLQKRLEELRHKYDF